MTVEELKRAAARAALDHLPEAGVIGLGSGTTAAAFIEELAPLVLAGRRYIGVPTSEATRGLAAGLGIPLLDDEGPWGINVCVDGADEVSAGLDLIKGGGYSHAREKIVSAAAALRVTIVDEYKLSDRLGERRAVPVEVLVFGHRQTALALAEFGAVRLRERGGRPAISDAGNLIYDIDVGPMERPADVDAALHAIPGVVETGLFIGHTDILIVGAAAGVRIVRAGA